jgi:hypothetical protein
VGDDVSLYRLVSKPGYPGGVVFWQVAMAISPIVAAVATPVLGGLLGGFADDHRLDALINFVAAIKFVGTMCFPFAAYFAARGRWDLARARASVTWPTVPGKVEWSRIEKTKAVRGPLFYRLAIAYCYEVDGRTYQGDTVQFGPPRITDRELIEKLADKYPAGKDVTVHYNPYAPEDAVLETSDEMAAQNGWRVWFFIGGPILVGIVTAIKNA